MNRQVALNLILLYYQGQEEYIMHNFKNEYLLNQRSVRLQAGLGYVRVKFRFEIEIGQR